MISVIIPAYNAECYIEETIRSVLEQTYQEFEILIVDDGSTDYTLEICKEICKQSDKINLYHKENSGVSDTRNYGVERAKGQYLLFLDADDLLPRYALEILVNEMEKGDFGAVFGSHAYLYDNKILPRTMRIVDGIYIYEEVRAGLVDDGTLTGMLFGSSCGVLYDKKVIDQYNLRFRSDLKINEDGFFNLQVIKNVKQFKVFNKPYVYLYRQWKVNKKEKLEDDFRLDLATKAITKYVEEINEAGMYCKQLKCRNVSVAFWNILQIKDTVVDKKTAIGYLKKVLRKSDVIEGMKYMNFSNMNKYKKIICYLIKYKQETILYYLMKRIYPLMAGLIKR